MGREIVFVICLTNSILLTSRIGVFRTDETRNTAENDGSKTTGHVYVTMIKLDCL